MNLTKAVVLVAQIVNLLQTVDSKPCSNGDCIVAYIFRYNRCRNYECMQRIQHQYKTCLDRPCADEASFLDAVRDADNSARSKRKRYPLLDAGTEHQNRV